MYELDDYLAMVTDEVRTPAYLAAMAQVIRPGDVVLELGTGFGYFAVHACRLGAAHVWAVEPNDAVGLGRALAAANGCADRITFVQGLAQSLQLPARANVLIEDLRGISPLHGTRLAVLIDAQRRLLTPDARRVPIADELRLAPTEMPEDLARIAPGATDEVHGISIASVKRIAYQALHRTRARVAGLLAAPATWARLDYATLGGVDVAGRAEWVFERTGRCAGFASWFAATLAPGIGFETSQDTPRTVYDRAFLPIGEPVDVLAGDELLVQVRAKYDEVDYVWVWDVELRRAGAVIERRRCSNLATRAMSAARRARRAADHVPARSPEVARMQALFTDVDGAASLGEIAARLAARHPEAFPDPQAALRWAGERLARLDEESTP